MGVSINMSLLWMGVVINLSLPLALIAYDYKIFKGLNNFVLFSGIPIELREWTPEYKVEAKEAC